MYINQASSIEASEAMLLFGLTLKNDSTRFISLYILASQLIDHAIVLIFMLYHSFDALQIQGKSIHLPRRHIGDIV